MKNIVCEISIEKINSKMKELEEILDYKFNNIELLAEAMCSIRLKSHNESKNHREYSNEKLAMVGDAILNAVVVDKLYLDKLKTKEEISNLKTKIINNNLLHDLLFEYCIINYAFNSLHFYDDLNIYGNEQVVSKKHDAYMEAIIGAIYYDAGFDQAKIWV